MKSKIWDKLWKGQKKESSFSIMNSPGSAALRSEFIGLLQKYFGVKGKSILEVGTGTGQYCIELDKRGARCIGIDKESESIELAQRVAKDYDANCVFHKLNLFDVPERADIVISMGVLEHFEDKMIVKMLKKMSTLGDHVVVGVPYSGSGVYTLSKAFAIQNGSWPYGIERDFYSLQNLFEKAGMELISEEVIGSISEANYLMRLNQILVPIQTAHNLEQAFHNYPVGSWLIATGKKYKCSREPVMSQPVKKYDEGVSIIVPVYNGEKHLKRCIENVQEITYPNLDVIFVNDGSTDKTQKILDKADMTTIILDKNVGVSEARLVGIYQAIYEHIFFLDVDDLVFPNCINKLMDDFTDGTHLSVSCALMTNNKFTGQIWAHEFLQSPKDYILSELKDLCGKISLGSTIIKKDMLIRAYKELHNLLDKVGIERMNISEDSILLDIMVMNGDITQIIPVCYTYRGYGYDTTSASHNYEDRLKDIPLQMAYCLKMIDDEKEVNDILIDVL